MVPHPAKTALVLTLASLLVGCAGRPAPTVLTAPPLVGGADRAWARQVLAAADVVYVGEVHDRASDHAYQAAWIADAAAVRVPVAVGWEMFDQTQTPLLHAFDAGRLSRAELFRRTGFDRAWAPYSPWYAHILEGNRRAGVRNVALNAPPALVHKVATGEALTPGEHAQLPRGFRVSEEGFRHFASLLGTHPGVDDGSLRRFFAAQCVWDQTMADAVLAFHRGEPGVKLIVLTGRGHVSGGYGVPAFVRQKAGLRQVVLLPE